MPHRNGPATSAGVEGREEEKSKENIRNSAGAGLPFLLSWGWEREEEKEKRSQKRKEKQHRKEYCMNKESNSGCHIPIFSLKGRCAQEIVSVK